MIHYLRQFSLIILVCFAIGQVLAQQSFELSGEPKLKISGTSTLHDWDMVSNQAKGKGKFTLEDNKIHQVRDLSIEMPAESIKSGKNGMDKNAYAALKTKNHKTVTFKLTDWKSNGGQYQATGDFTIAGKTRSVTFPVDTEFSGENILIKGSHDCKLTDFDIDPPTALLGTVKTGNDVTIHFEVLFKPL
ncbi:YceI family protein [Pararhodonellum marinum]|uniref:YceI family protein n=1 Tax=Pararhodonellum marinum TaxID=2755358 RepID=UPI00188FCFAD|nr:YceI family protein [Pararhodonellum marinum]